MIIPYVSQAARLSQICIGSSSHFVIQSTRDSHRLVSGAGAMPALEAGSLLPRSGRGRWFFLPAPVRLTPGPLFGTPAHAGDRETGSWTPAASPGLSVNRPAPGRHHDACRAGGLGKAEADVVVPVVGVVPVPVRYTQVLRFVVPGPTPDHTLAASWPIPLVNTTWEKIDRRRPSVSACWAWPIQLCTEATTVAHSRPPVR